MPTLLLYMLKLSCLLSIVWLFYRIFLHDLTFYNSSRWYLVASFHAVNPSAKP